MRVNDILCAIIYGISQIYGPYDTNKSYNTTLRMILPSRPIRLSVGMMQRELGGGLTYSSWPFTMRLNDQGILEVFYFDDKAVQAGLYVETRQLMCLNFHIFKPYCLECRRHRICHSL